MKNIERTRGTTRWLPARKPICRRLCFLITLWFSVSAQAIEPEVLYSFSAGSGPREPYSSLIQDGDGNFYGTSIYGGTNGYGTVFKFALGGDIASLVSFGPSGSTNGTFPKADLIKGRDGHFYSTTYGGGISNCGTVFRISSNGIITHLASLAGTYGSNPYSALTESDGILYGTGWKGGTNNMGTVYKLTPGGELVTMVDFKGQDMPLGRAPQSSLSQGQDGYFYGTTWMGGIFNCGTVFKVSPAGDFTNLVSFNGTNGAYVYAGLVQDRNGCFYGATYRGGANDAGTVFKMTTNGTLTTLFSFQGTNGSIPYAGLVQGMDGYFYGHTSQGGMNNAGTVYKISDTGAFTSLFSFTGSNGRSPRGKLYECSDGYFYGTTQNGGPSNVGVVYRFPIPTEISIDVLPDKTVQVHGRAYSNFTYSIEVSTNLLHWVSLTNVTSSTGIISHTDNDSTNHLLRFYRVASSPR